MKFLTTVLTVLLLFSFSAMADSGSINAPKKQKVQKVFVFDPKTKTWAAYENGRKIKSGVANGGKPGYKTPTGVFYVYNKAGANHVSSKYPVNSNGTRGGAPMPYAMHFTKAGHAIHGSPQISNQNSSHGCIRVKTDAARWLQNFITPGTKIIVYPY